jgi:hypothetical protein
MQPDFSALFRRNTVTPLHFHVRNGASFVHDVQFLSSYLHDARFTPKDITKRGKTLSLIVERDCWELGFIQNSRSSELHTAKSRLRITPVSAFHWETSDEEKPRRELWIESIYLGASHWETPEETELVISAPHGGWKLRVSVADDYGDIRLDDLETPHLYSKRKA